MSRLLVTGAAGYVGSHCVAEFLDAGHEVVGVDDLSNSCRSVVDTLHSFGDGFTFHHADIRDTDSMARCFSEAPIDAVVHLAGVKSVAESSISPIRYWSINVGGTISILRSMSEAGVTSIVFSSSCTVYGEADGEPVRESDPIAPTNTYGRTKAAAEQVISDTVAASGQWRGIALRYFNPAGAHPSGLLGDNPTNSSPNLVPACLDAALKGESIVVNGADYPTADGTCERDYVHIADVARGHVAAVSALETVDGFEPINLGTGRRTSVLDVVGAAADVTERSITTTIGPRRVGDAAAVGADPSLARRVLDWKAELDLASMCASHWAWLARQDGVR
jgi:UDP-glucose 4-epimerase